MLAGRAGGGLRLAAACRKLLATLLAGALSLGLAMLPNAGTAYGAEGGAAALTSELSAAWESGTLPALTAEEEKGVASAVLALDTKDVVAAEDLISLLEANEVEAAMLLSVHVEALEGISDAQRSELVRLQRLLLVAEPEAPGGGEAAQDPDGSSGAEQDGADGAPGSEASDDDAAHEAPDGAAGDASGAEGPDPAEEAETGAADAAPDAAPGDAPREEAGPSSEAAGAGSGAAGWTYEGDASFDAKAPGDMSTAELVAVLGEHARQISQEHGIYASVMLAQAILESSSGGSALASQPYYNLFGIKSQAGEACVKMLTLEHDGEGRDHIVSAGFRSYDSPIESLLDYASLLTDRGATLYSGAWRCVAGDPEEACRWMQGRYATDEDYAEKLLSIIDEYELEKYDEALGYELVDEIEVPVKADDGSGFARNPETGEVVYERRGLLDLVDEVASHLGEPYVWGGTKPGSFDCSGLVQYSYREALGIELPRTTYFQCLVGDDVDFDDLHMGDLVFFTNFLGVCSHVGMYVGGGCYIEAPKPGDVVKVTSTAEKPPAFAKRVLETRDIEPAEGRGADAEGAKGRTLGALATKIAKLVGTKSPALALLRDSDM